MRAMAERLLGDVAPACGARWLIASPVTNHDWAQRSCRTLGFSPLGLLLGVYPASTTMDGIGRATQPVSVALRGLRLERGAARPRALGLEGEDARRAREVLAGLGVPARGGAAALDDGPLAVDLLEDPAIGLAHLRLVRASAPAAGRDADAASRSSLASPPGARREGVEALLDDALLGRLGLPGRRLVWVDVPAEHAAAGDVARRLRARGFGWAAYLPGAGRDGEDVARLQRYQDGWPLCRDEVRVTDDAARLADDVLADAASHGAA